METDKEIVLISSPETKSDHPVPPVYEPLWDASKVIEKVESLVTFRGNEARPVINESDIVGLVLLVIADYDKALSKALFERWQFEGMLKEKTNGN